MEHPSEELSELVPGQWVVVEPSRLPPTPAVYLGWARDERGDIVAIVRPKGWTDAQTLMLHPSRIVETEWDPNPIAPESAWKE